MLFHEFVYNALTQNTHWLYMYNLMIIILIPWKNKDKTNKKVFAVRLHTFRNKWKRINWNKEIFRGLNIYCFCFA